MTRKVGLPSEIAAIIVSQRLPCYIGFVSEETVHDACKRRKKGAGRSRRKSMKKFSLANRLLMSIFFDLNSNLPESGSLFWQGKILDILTKDYPPIAVYYLVRFSHFCKGKIYAGEYDFGEVKKLCDTISQDTAARPFSRLIKESKIP